MPAARIIAGAQWHELTNFVLGWLMDKNVTIRLSEPCARSARIKAAEANQSVSRWVGALLEREMCQTDEYWQAYRRWKSSLTLGEVPYEPHPDRAEMHERGHRG
jgi:hypothetical protein